jgi:soluble lytic murein transglycosylase-like protein
MIGKKWVIKVYSLCLFCLAISYLSWADGIYVYKDKNGILHFTNMSPMSPSYHNYQEFEDWTKARFFNSIGPRYQLSNGFIKKIAERYDVSPALTKAIIKVESNFNHLAVSKSGAQGLMQLMPETAEDLGVWYPFSPEENIEGGVRYLKMLLSEFKGDLSAALAAYFIGPNAFLETGHTPKTEKYVQKVLHLS